MRLKLVLGMALLGLSACQQKASDDQNTDGVNVGNGRTDQVTHQTDSFQVTFAKSLRLTQLSATEFTIDDSPSQSQESVSTAKFAVLDEKIKSLEELQALVQEEHPGAVCTLTQFPNAQGYVFEKAENTDYSKAWYYILTDDFAVIRVNVRAYHALDSSNQVYPIMKTFQAKAVSTR